MPAAHRFPALIGVIHLPPLAGVPGSARLHPASALQIAGVRAVEEARLLTRAGFGGLILENFGDVPFYKDRVPPETIASLAVVAAAVKEVTRLPIGINVLRNDGRAALAIASVTDCEFIRINVLSGVAAADQGLIEGEAAFLLRERERIGAHPLIFADVHVKHAQTLSSDDLGTALEDTALRAKADAVIISGAGTGKPVALEVVRQASRFAGRIGVPLYLGSGVISETIGDLRGLVTGAIVSSDLRRQGRAGAPLDPARVRRFMAAFTKAGKSSARTRPAPRRTAKGKR